MLSSSIRASLVALVASAAVVSAGPGLTVVASTHSNKVDGLGNLKVTATVTNTGDQTLKLLKDPRGVLNTFPENTFSITDAAGSSPSFNGAKVKYSPAYTAGRGDPNSFTVLAPGASVDIVHDLSAAYNFTRAGAGDYSIKPSTLFTYVDADGTPKNIRAIDGSVAKVKISGALAVSRSHDKRAKFNSCSSTQQTQLDDAASGAQMYAFNAYGYISGMNGTTPRYTTWFGVLDSARKNTVQSHYQLMNGGQYASFTYDCTCTDKDTYAYVYPEQFGTVYLCGAFWAAPNIGTDSKAGTLIHESSHFTLNGGTDDFAYGQTSCKTLAIEDPSQAVMNADSHEYFAENNPVEA